MIGTLWVVSAPYALLYQTTHLGLMMASAISKGLAGGTIVLQAAHWTLLADVTSTNAKWRSTYTGMALLTRLFGFKAAGWIVAMFQDAMGAEQQAALIASCIWVAYVVAVEEWYHPDLVLVDDEAEPWACTLILRSIAGPILAMFQNATTILLATSYLCAQLAICIVENMVASMLMRGYADSMPKYTSEALGLLRGAMVCALLALFVLVIHRYRVEEGQSTPLNKDAPELSTKQTFLWTQELSGSQFGFLVGMTSILVCMLSEASVQFILAELSVFVLPSLITMVTFTAEPSRLGTVLTGFALVERFTTAVTKSLPVFLMRSGIFFGHHPRTLWYIAMTFFATGGVLTMFVKRTSRKA
ncbi:hypothetical protein BXZ70DRAFT_331499 [Cristinia sonorae]|uniref:Uncharacterized protein n=1 Tax=Cristinia sonorae TaxID=1940300 RepID=A0A8K0UK69_9AGAR|nr:hypothetical protein BXZ70DRAFT_331499 [Cristinia sonorae]